MIVSSSMHGLKKGTLCVFVSSREREILYFSLNVLFSILLFSYIRNIYKITKIVRSLIGREACLHESM